MAVSPNDVNLVQLYVYDISRGMSRMLSRALIGKHVDGIWHTGVVVYGREYFFGSHGISNCSPGGTILGEPLQIEILGETQIPYEIFYEFLSEMEKNRFRGSEYHLLNHNCNTFSNELAEFLVGVRIPAHILDLPKEVMDTPIGATIASLIDNLGPVPTNFHPDCTVGKTPPASVDAADALQPVSASASASVEVPNGELGAVASASSSGATVSVDIDIERRERQIEPVLVEETVETNLQADDRQP